MNDKDTIELLKDNGIIYRYNPKGNCVIGFSDLFNNGQVYEIFRNTAEEYNDNNLKFILRFLFLDKFSSDIGYIIVRSVDECDVREFDSVIEPLLNGVDSSSDSCIFKSFNMVNSEIMAKYFDFIEIIRLNDELFIDNMDELGIPIMYESYDKFLSSGDVVELTKNIESFEDDVEEDEELRIENLKKRITKGEPIFRMSEDSSHKISGYVSYKRLNDGYLYQLSCMVKYSPRYIKIAFYIPIYNSLINEIVDFRVMIIDKFYYREVINDSISLFREIMDSIINKITYCEFDDLDPRRIIDGVYESVGNDLLSSYKDKTKVVSLLDSFKMGFEFNIIEMSKFYE